MPVTIYDIARKSGVSVVTVSRVINNHATVRASNRQKVLAAMRELDYRPNAAARSLARGRTGMVGLILPSVADAFMSQIVCSIESHLKQHGLFLVVAIAEEGDGHPESSSMRLFSEERVDGILVLSPVRSVDYLLELKRRSFPFVLLDQHKSELSVPTIAVDNYDGGYQATAVLIRGGARRIAHVGGPETFESSRERERGFRAALADSSLSGDASLLSPGDFTFQAGYNAMREWGRARRLPDAVFAADDATAFGVMDAAREMGIRIPSELSVIGFDDHPFSATFHPPLSTVRQPAEEMGAIGVQMLLDLFGARMARAPTIVLKPRVILRDTTRPLPPER